MRIRDVRSELGSVSVVTAALLLMTVVVSLASMDVMEVLSAKDRVQMAADAAALAAAQELLIPTDRTPAEVAADYAADNDAQLISCRCDSGSSEVVVAVKRVVSLPFLGGRRTVIASARAIVEPG